VLPNAVVAGLDFIALVLTMRFGTRRRRLPSRCGGILAGFPSTALELGRRSCRRDDLRALARILRGVGELWPSVLPLLAHGIVVFAFASIRFARATR
jgi:hypothetical protein